MSNDFKIQDQDLSGKPKIAIPGNFDSIENNSPTFLMDRGDEEPVRLFAEPAFSSIPIKPKDEEVLPPKEDAKDERAVSKSSNHKPPKEKKSKNTIEQTPKTSKKTLGELPPFEEVKNSSKKIMAINNFNEYEELERADSNSQLVNQVINNREIQDIEIIEINQKKQESSTHSVSQEESEKEKDLDLVKPTNYYRPEPEREDEFEEDKEISEEKEDNQSENNQPADNNIIDNNEQEESQNSYGDLSNEENNYSDDNKGNYDENMPRLAQDINDGEDDTRQKKKMRKIKFKKSVKTKNQNGEDEGKRNKKKERSHSKKGSQVKKSYHAYLEHPRLRHQPPGNSQKEAKEMFDPLNMMARPGRR